jgi:xanthine dehydrogenase accessory factor
VTPEIRDALMRARAARRPVVLATRLGDGVQYLLPDTKAEAGLGEAAAAALAADVSATITLGAEAWFLHVHQLPLRLLVIGAVHIAQALTRLANPLGLSTTVIDPRDALATEERFPRVTRLTDWPDEALARLSLDHRCAVVALTHDPKLDDPALDCALRSSAFYIGALGSRNSHAARCERLSALGHDRAALARIRGPVGLAIGAIGAPEIALSILAEIVATHRGAALGHRD